MLVMERNDTHEKLLLTLGVLIIVVAGYFGYTYYATTYRGITAYAITPNKVPEKTQTYSDSGEKSMALLPTNTPLNS